MCKVQNEISESDYHILDVGSNTMASHLSPLLQNKDAVWDVLRLCFHKLNYVNGNRDTAEFVLGHHPLPTKKLDFSM